MYHPSFLPREEADGLLASLLAGVPWEQRSVRLFGRVLPQPRLVHWVADFPYTYSGLTLPAAAWPPAVRELRDRVERAVHGAAGSRFDGVLLNLYRDGRDAMGFHGDDEEEIVPGSEIASVTLGAARPFVVKARHGGAAPLEIALAHGSLLVMGGTLQRDNVHGVPRRPRVTLPRVNLTFRQHRHSC